MSNSFTKLYGSIIHSTIWREDDKTRIVWITILALADEAANVMASVPGLADAARVSIAECESAIQKLSSPDKYSRSKEQEGRRIVEIDGGWHIINRNKYRDKTSDRTEYWKQYKRTQRGKPSTVDKVDNVESPPISTQVEVETEVETEGRGNPTPEQIAEEDFNKTKTDSTLPAEFWVWFEREVRSRWDKYTVNATLIGDWYALYVEFGADDLSTAVQAHLSESKRWEPCLAMVKQAVTAIRTKRKNQERESQKQIPPSDPPDISPPLWEGEADAVAGRYKKTDNRLTKKLIEKNRPDVMKLLKTG